MHPCSISIMCKPKQERLYLLCTLLKMVQSAPWSCLNPSWWSICVPKSLWCTLTPLQNFQILLLGYPPPWHQLPSPSFSTSHHGGHLQQCRCHREQLSHRNLASHSRSKLVLGSEFEIEVEKLCHHRASDLKSEQKSSTPPCPYSIVLFFNAA